MTRPGRCSDRGGFSLIELIVTMTILSIALAGLVPLARRVSAISNQSTGQTQRIAALGGEVQRVEAIPFDSLELGRRCRVVTSAFPHTICLTVAAVNGKTWSALVVVTPQSSAVGPDTAVVERNRSAGTNPLNPP